MEKFPANQIAIKWLFELVWTALVLNIVEIKELDLWWDVKWGLFAVITIK